MTDIPQNQYTEKAQASLMRVVEAFKRGDIAECCAVATFPPLDIPACNWSLANRWLAFIQSGEVDCRGFRQWQDVGRAVHKGAGAVYITRPRMVRVEDEETGEPVQVVTGFVPQPVFAKAETDGAPLDYENVSLPALPLLDVARAWGIEIEAAPFMGQALGQWSAEQRRITMFCSDEVVFFHELAHAAHDRTGHVKTTAGQDPHREIVAQLAAEVLMRLVGITDVDSSGNSYAYIEHYAGVEKSDVVTACLKVLGETAKVVGLILETAEGLHAGGD